MKFGYGGWRAEAGEFSLRAFDVPATRNEAGFLEKVTRILQVEFEIVRDTQAAITARFNQIANAIKQDGRDVGFYEDSGARSAIFIENAKTATGVRITQFPSIQPSDGADYASHLKGSCAFAADYLPGAFGAFGAFGGGGQQNYVAYRESVSVRGNGRARTAYDVTDRSRPRRFVLADFTPVFAQQSGSIEVISNAPVYPAPNPPLWPNLLVNEQVGDQKSLEAVGDGTYRMTQSWMYQFESDGPIFGRPRAR